MTLADLRALLRLTLSSASAWPDGTLDRWIGSAIRLYSAHFPRRVRSLMTLNGGVQMYTLPGGFDVRGVISVEHPVVFPLGSTPPRYLRQVLEDSAAFVGGGPVYALRSHDSDPSTAMLSILFGETIGPGESAVVEYWGLHAVPAVGEDAAVMTVPAQHIEAISAYVEFAAHYELETDEALAADGSTVVLSQLGDESRRAWNRYKEVMDRLTWLGGGQLGNYQPSWAGIGL